MRTAVLVPIVYISLTIIKSMFFKNTFQSINDIEGKSCESLTSHTISGLHCLYNYSVVESGHVKNCVTFKCVFVVELG